jgi:hypothetical protein
MDKRVLSMYEKKERRSGQSHNCSRHHRAGHRAYMPAATGLFDTAKHELIAVHQSPKVKGHVQFDAGVLLSSRSSFCSEFLPCEGPEARAKQAWGFATIDEMGHFVESSGPEAIHGSQRFTVDRWPLNRPRPPATT